MQVKGDAEIRNWAPTVTRSIVCIQFHQFKRIDSKRIPFFCVNCCFYGQILCRTVAVLQRMFITIGNSWHLRSNDRLRRSQAVEMQWIFQQLFKKQTFVYHGRPLFNFVVLTFQPEFIILANGWRWNQSILSNKERKKNVHMNNERRAEAWKFFGAKFSFSHFYLNIWLSTVRINI